MCQIFARFRCEPKLMKINGRESSQSIFPYVNCFFFSQHAFQFNVTTTSRIQLSSRRNRPTKNWRDTLQGKPEARDAVIYAAKRGLQIGFAFSRGSRIRVSQLDAVVTLCKKHLRPSIQEFQCRIRSSAPISAAERDNSIRKISRKNSTFSLSRRI